MIEVCYPVKKFLGIRMIGFNDKRTIELAGNGDNPFHHFNIVCRINKHTSADRIKVANRTRKLCYDIIRVPEIPDDIVIIPESVF